MQDEAKAQGTVPRFDVLQILPPEIRYLVFSYMTVEDLLRLATVSKQWNLWTEDSYLWQKHFRTITLGMKAKDREREARLAESLGWKARLLLT